MTTKEIYKENRNHCKFKYGDSVRITYGFYENSTGTIEGRKDKDNDKYIVSVNYGESVIVEEKHLEIENDWLMLCFYTGVLIMVGAGIYALFKGQYFITGFDIVLLSVTYFMKKSMRVLGVNHKG